MTTFAELMTSPAPTREAAQVALVELFVLANSMANHKRTGGESVAEAERCFAIVMRHIVGPPP